MKVDVFVIVKKNAENTGKRMKKFEQYRPDSITHLAQIEKPPSLKAVLITS